MKICPTVFAINPPSLENPTALEVLIFTPINFISGFVKNSILIIILVLSLHFILEVIITSICLQMKQIVNKQLDKRPIVLDFIDKNYGMKIMSANNLALMYAPNPIFKMRAEAVVNFDDKLKTLIEEMFSVLYLAKAVGLAGNMLGVLKQIVIIDLQTEGVKNPHVFINPTVTYVSTEMQTCNEASLSFPGIEASITRPKQIHISYFDLKGERHELEADGFFATVIQHEIDYLNGVVFLDHLSKMKRDILLQKMSKHIKAHPPHVHTEHCHH